MSGARMSCAYHIADFDALLAADPTIRTAREALTRLHGDGLAQILSYVCVSDSKTFRTLSAVSPQARCDAELMSTHLTDSAVNFHAQIDEKTEPRRAVFYLNATPQTAKSRSVALTRWWAMRCPLPLLLDVNNKLNDYFSFEDAALHDRIETLRVTISKKKQCKPQGKSKREAPSALCGGRCGDVLCALPTFTHLQRLSITFVNAVVKPNLVKHITHVLREAARMSVREVQLLDCHFLKDYTPLSNADSSSVERVVVTGNGLRSFAGMSSCAQLTMINVSDCTALKTLKGIAGAPRLARLIARRCALESLEGVASCVALTYLAVDSNPRLQSLRGVGHEHEGSGSTAGNTAEHQSGRARLRISACDCDLLTLNDVGSCGHVEELVLDRNKSLHSVLGMAAFGAPDLDHARLSAAECLLVDFGNTRMNNGGNAEDGNGDGLRFLTHIDIHGNDTLVGLSWLASAVHLTHLYASSCHLTTLEGLEQCVHLIFVDVDKNSDLTSLRGLEAAARLTTLSARACNLRSLDGITATSSFCLTSVRVDRNLNLESIAQLAGAPLLRTVKACGCGLTALDGLGTCARLEEVHVDNNRPLRSLEGLAGAPLLRTVKACGCGLTALDGLSTCARLEEVHVDNNQDLRSLGGLAAAPLLSKLFAGQCALTALDGLSTCARLEEVHVDDNRPLRSLEGLAAAPLLQTVKASSCGLITLGELHTCPMLFALNVSWNAKLEDVSGLAGAPSLTYLYLNRCNITSIAALRDCGKLQYLDVSFNRRLASVEAAADMPKLAELFIQHCRVQDYNKVKCHVYGAEFQLLTKQKKAEKKRERQRKKVERRRQEREQRRNQAQ